MQLVYYDQLSKGRSQNLRFCKTQKGLNFVMGLFGDSVYFWGIGTYAFNYVYVFSFCHVLSLNLVFYAQYKVKKILFP